jgi:8-oxo-dGTP pyrophosphatase MutT (NUDIX family)
MPARRTLGVRAVVVDGEGRVCLVRHTYRHGWFLPGGGVKTGEAIPDAMRRELYEETGVRPVETPSRVLGVYSSFEEHKSDHIVVFVIEDWERDDVHSPEIAEVAFFRPGQLPEGTSAATNRRVQEWTTGVPPGHRW